MKTIRINPSDNVAVALEALAAGDSVAVGGQTFRVVTDIPAGHKVALRDFSPGDAVVKYGFPIGHAVEPIVQGALVNEQNLKTNLGGVQDYAYTPAPVPQLASPVSPSTFQGYRRANGQVGTRNEIWVVPTVGCVNGVAQQLAETLRSETDGEGVDAIVAFPHNYGCSQLGDDHENTRRILRNLVLHPNAGGVLVVGLGCENNQPAAFRDLLGAYDEERVAFLVAQQCDDELAEGMTLLRRLYARASADRREEVPVSELKVGLKCGGSDGFSGITANPLLGGFSDWLVAQGGTAVLTEVPEMFGAETLLMSRCRDRSTFEKTVSLINEFKQYFLANHQPVYENPSPGNKAGGISTLEEKSLGCTQKSGTSAVQDVLPYGGVLTTAGLNLLSAPGNDLVASTALAAAGCQLVLFTTGRGTPFGTFVPTLKVATNSDLARRKAGWIDFNAGSIAEGVGMEEVLRDFTAQVLAVASGERVNNEKKNYREIAIFKTGVTL